MELKQNQNDDSESIQSKVNNLSNSLNQKLTNLSHVVGTMNKELRHENNNLNHRIDHINSGLYEFYRTLSNDPRSKPYAEHLLAFIESNKKFYHNQKI